MLTIDHDETGTKTEDAPSRSLSLLPADGSFERRATLVRAARPDAGFVTHLIATAAQLPQTRHLRRAGPADAQSAYAARLQPVAGVGHKTRHII